MFAKGPETSYSIMLCLFLPYLSFLSLRFSYICEFLMFCFFKFFSSILPYLCGVIRLVRFVAHLQPHEHVGTNDHVHQRTQCHAQVHQHRLTFLKFKYKLKLCHALGYLKRRFSVTISCNSYRVFAGHGQ